MAEFEISTEYGTKTYSNGKTYMDVARDFQKYFENDIVLVIVNKKLRELMDPVTESAEVTFVTTKDAFGYHAYRRTASFLMVKSVYDVLGHESGQRVKIHFSIGKGFYCTIRDKMPVDEAFLQKIEKRMRELAEMDIPIEKEKISTDEAIRRFGKYGMKDKELLFTYRRASMVNIYRINEFEDYYYGYMLPSTGYLKVFKLFAYQEGFVLQMPDQDNPKVLPSFEPTEKLFLVLMESERGGDKLGIESVGALNSYISNHDYRELLLVQEAQQERKIGQLAETIAMDREKKFVLIAGPSSSGKTTFSHRLAIQLSVNGLKPHTLAVDNYFVDREFTPVDEEGKLNYECMEAVDVEKLNQDLTALLEGKTVEIPKFNFKLGKREYKGDYLTLGENDVLVVEGIHCLNDKLTYALPKKHKFKIYISALMQLKIDEHNRIPTTDGRLLRRIVRDARTRGTSARETIAMWPSVRKGEEDNIFPFQEEADAMINSALLYELAVLKMYAQPALFGIPRDCPEYLEAKRLLKFLDYFVGIGSDNIPQNSILREFIGGGCFEL